MSRCARAVDLGRLLMEPLDDERLVYDTKTERAHSMSALAWSVLGELDGKTSTATLARRFSTSPPIIDATLCALVEAGLVTNVPAIDRSRRRALLGLAAAAPIVLSIVAPSVAEAASVVRCDPAGGCVRAGDCCGSSGGPAKTCGANLKCGSNAGNSPCKGSICL